MTYALITTIPFTIANVLPDALQRIDTGEWVTPPEGAWPDHLAAACGYLPVAPASRPADTATDTHEPTYTRDGATVVQSWTPRPWTAEELADRAEQAARLDDLEAKIAILWAAVFPPDPEPEPGEPVTAPEFSGIWHPGTRISDAGKVWLNASGVPLTTPPSGFPGSPSQWSHLFVEVTDDPDPDPGPGTPANYRGPWSPDTDYAVDDTCSRHGHYWQALVAHGAAYAGTWGPPTTGVWADLGPVA